MEIRGLSLSPSCVQIQEIQKFNSHIVSVTFLQLQEIQKFYSYTLLVTLLQHQEMHKFNFHIVLVNLCLGFAAQSTQWGHVERGQFT